jgi:putative spermidine/putrescine transport system permease protein
VISPGARISLAVWSALVIAFLWIPLLIIALYAFNGPSLQSWPISHLTFHWFSVAWHSGARSAFDLSLKVGAVTTVIALVLGTMASAAVARYRFFGREAVSFLLVLPLALPGIITGMALNSFFTFAGISVSMWTIVIGHATFCVVVVYNNVVARLRRTSSSLVEASQDLGADGWQTFRFVLWPVLSTALVAGGLLAFALSFDEVIVTTFTAGLQQTLPLYILDNIRQGQQLPVINVVAFLVIAITVIPIALAQRVMRDTGIIRGGGAAAH